MKMKKQDNIKHLTDHDSSLIEMEHKASAEMQIKMDVWITVRIHIFRHKILLVSVDHSCSVAFKMANILNLGCFWTICSMKLLLTA